MKKIVIFLFFTGFSGLVNSQDFDLIVNNKGDSIACRIDSVTDSHIYFQMKVNSVWRSTYLFKNNVKSYSENAINKKEVNFNPGSSVINNSHASTTYIGKGKNVIHTDIGTLAFWAFWSINYEVTLKENPGRNIIRFRTGYLYRWDDRFYGIPLGVTTLYGRSKSFFEFSAAIVPTIDMEWSEGSIYEERYEYTRASVYPLVEIGYRKEPGKDKIFYRFMIGSAGLSVGFGYAF